MSTNKGSQAVFINEYPIGDSEAVKELSQMTPMYPFKVFKKTNIARSMHRLSDFVQYVFLYTGTLDKVHADSLVTVGEALIPAVSTINSIYESKGNSNIHQHLASRIDRSRRRRSNP
jgi:hypothetical protein